MTATVRPAMSRSLVALLLLWNSVLGVPKGSFYEYGEDYGDRALPQTDEAASSAVKFSLPLLFYNQPYESIYINVNGLISFLTELPNFYNVPFPLDYPLIAPLYTDVDLRGGGSVFYRVTDQQRLLRRFDSDVARLFTGGREFKSRQLLVVTWDQVGYYDRQTDRVNSFQAVVGWDGRETFLQLLYADGGIQWIRGQGKTVHQPDARAQAAVISGDGRMKQLPYSGADQVRHLDKLTNADEPGLFMFRVGRIPGGEEVAEPDTDVAKPSEAVSDRPATCADQGITCHSRATCHDHLDGFCCVCNVDFFGNGKNCIPSDEPLRVMGKVHGTINGFAIDNQDLQAYAVVTDGRSYTSMAKIIPGLGYDLQSLMPINDIIGWMFAKAPEGTRNGFQLTGGVANVTIEVDYPQTGDQVTIRQDFHGMGVFNHLEVTTRLTGTVPAIPFGEGIVMGGYTNSIVTLGYGRIQISSQRQYSTGENTLSTPLRVGAEISFEECQGQPQRSELAQLKHTVDRNFIRYEEAEQIVRYASSNAMSSLADADPCKDPEKKCGPNSICTPEGGDRFRCDCRPGFVYDYRRDPLSDASPQELQICVDINECERNLDNCDPNAICQNEFGSYSCVCAPEYTGNGQYCERLLSCADLMCGENAQCYEYSRGSPVCECDIGFSGNGTHCQLIPTSECRSSADCGRNAECRYSEWKRVNECVCVQGYEPLDGDCAPTAAVPGPCGDSYCHWDASCVEVQPGQPGCVCNPGFFGNGLECRPAEQQVCQTANDCGPNAECIYADWAGGNVCVCLKGYFGDGMRCHIATSLAVLCEGVECHPAADCQLVEGIPRCVCNPGLEGDGYTVCKAAPTEKRCETFADCGKNAECAYADWLGTNICLCRVGFFGDGINCTIPTELAVICNDVQCDPDAECLETDEGLQCICKPDYVGDGQYCEPAPTDIPCRSTEDCGPNSGCEYAPWAERYVCLCDQGYQREAQGCIAVPTPAPGPIPGLQDCLQDLDCPAGQRCEYEVNTGLFVCMPPAPTVEPPTQPPPTPGPTVPDCTTVDVCSPDGVCAYDVTQDLYVCTCQPGYSGDGYTCIADQPVTAAPTPEQTTTPAPIDRLEASCIFGLCVCPEGFELTFDMEECVRLPETPLPQCYDGVCACPATYQYVPETQTCAPGEEGAYETKGPSGTAETEPETEPTTTVPPSVVEVSTTAEPEVEVTSLPEYSPYGDLVCEYDTSVCPPEATCQFSPRLDYSICVCRQGYQREADRCVPIPTPVSPPLPPVTTPVPQPQCFSDADCDDNALCVFNTSSGLYQCSCFPGYSLDGSSCVPDPEADCAVLRDCHPEASCVYNRELEKHECQCRRGYDGDGKECTQITLGCNILDNCGDRAECQYIQNELRFRCVCRQGYTGDGYTCRPSVSCYDDPTQCDVNAACVPDLDGFRCLCLKGFIGDGRQCSPAPRHDGGFLLLNQGSAVVRVPFEPNKWGRPVVIEPSQTAVGIDADCLEGRFFWTDVAGRKIKSAAYNGTNKIDFATGGIRSPEGVSVDFVSRNVYWTDSSQDTIEVAGIGTGNRFTVISSGLVNVRGVAVHPGRSTIYWADWNRQQPRIERASLDGSNRRVLIETGLGLPNSLAIDFSTEELCWTDAGTNSIECYSLVTQTRRVIASGASHPFGIAITDSHIYWTDWNDKKIHVVEKASGERKKSLRSVLGTSGKLYGLVATQRTCPPVSNACAGQNGGCHPDQLCLPTERGGRRCVCPDRLVAQPQPDSVCAPQ